MLIKLRNMRLSRNNEDGFTLIELLIVVVIIGILAAIAIPIFANQQKSAMVATVKSDIKNTNTNVVTESTRNNDMTAAEIEAVLPVTSNGNTILITALGSTYYDGYTICGSNVGLDTEGLCFNSITGKFEETGGNNNPGTGGVTHTYDQGYPTGVTAGKNDKENLQPHGTSYNWIGISCLDFDTWTYYSCGAEWEEGFYAGYEEGYNNASAPTPYSMGYTAGKNQVYGDAYYNGCLYNPTGWANTGHPSSGDPEYQQGYQEGYEAEWANSICA